jgi:hypothetical protein
MNLDSEIYGIILVFAIFLSLPLIAYYFILRRESSILNPKNYNHFDLDFTKPSKEE